MYLMDAPIVEVVIVKNYAASAFDIWNSFLVAIVSHNQSWATVQSYSPIISFSLTFGAQNVNVVSIPKC